MEHCCTKHKWSWKFALKRNVFTVILAFIKKNNVFCCYAVNTYVNFKTNSTITTTSTRYIVLTNCKRKTRKKIAYSYYISTASVWRQRRRKKEKKCQRPFFRVSFFYVFRTSVSIFLFYPILSNFNSHPFYLFDPIVQKSIRHNRTSHCVPTWWKPRENLKTNTHQKT